MSTVLHSSSDFWTGAEAGGNGAKRNGTRGGELRWKEPRFGLRATANSQDILSLVAIEREVSLVKTLLVMMGVNESVDLQSMDVGFEGEVRIAGGESNEACWSSLYFSFR